jgi:tRNA-2-methylthio-N6-dimethylallyladenosine synthase
MNRIYTREYYLERIKKIKEILPNCAISTDIIAGFCGETEQDHQDTLSLMREIGYEYAFMFKYSTREGTHAAGNYEDNISEELKIKRLEEIIALQQQLSLESNKKDIGKTFTVLVEGVSKRSDQHLFGRNPQNKVCVFQKKHYNMGDYVEVRIVKCTAGTLIGEAD